MVDAYSQAKSIVAALAKAGYIAYFAGGWVRDYIMKHPSEDIDIATNASPPEIMDLFPQTILVGLAFNVVIVVLEGHQFEVASFRKDLHYIDGRHPQAVEMSSPGEDALRRDFTINGMFYDPLEEVIHDFVHGQEDIRRAVIRTIGDPHERFFEDRLRMLRAFRFAARFGFSIDSETQSAIQENAHRLLPAVAMERIWQEFNKMVLHPRFDQAILDMHRLALLTVIFPELAGMHSKDLYQRVKNFPHFPGQSSAILYIMELLTQLPLVDKIDVAKRLKVPNTDIKTIEYMDALEQALIEEQAIKKVDFHKWAVLFAHPDWEVGMTILALRYADKNSESFMQNYRQRYQQLQPHIQRIHSKRPLITAAILQKMGIKPGKHMGLLLKEAEKLAVNENVHDPDSILATLTSLPLWKEFES